MTHQFAQTKAFADFIVSVHYDCAALLSMNTMRGEKRCQRVVEDIQQWANCPIDKGGIDQEYSQAAYGLRWVVLTEQVNAETKQAIWSMDVRQLCELIHELMAFDYDIRVYASYLMKKYTPFQDDRDARQVEQCPVCLIVKPSDEHLIQEYKEMQRARFGVFQPAAATAQDAVASITFLTSLVISPFA